MISAHSPIVSPTGTPDEGVVPNFTVADAIVDALQRNGVDVIFGIGGTHTLPLLGAIERARATFISARTELGAAYMAIGFARASGRSAVALTSTGPGALNAISALQDAQWSTLPLIHLTTTIGREPVGSFAGDVHETPVQHQLMALAGKDCLRLSPQDPYRAVTAAVGLANGHPRGPVTLEVPTGCLRAPASRPLEIDALSDSCPESSVQSDVNIDLSGLAEALRHAQRPVFFVGGGALAWDGGHAVLRLAEHLDAPLVTSYQGKSVADWTHPLYLGPWASESLVRGVVEQADVAVVFGSKLSALGTAGWQLPLPATTYRVDVNGRAHPYYHQLVEVVGDAANVAAELREQVAGQRRAAMLDVSRARTEITREARGRSELAMRYLSAMGAPELFAADMSKAGFWAMKFLGVRSPSVHAFSSYLAMGTALPMAVGMTVARRRAALVVVGDGGLQMSLAELGTIAEHRLPVTIVVLVDGAYGMLRDNSLAVGGSAELGLTLWNPDLARLADSFGMHHTAVHTPDDFASVLHGSADEPRMIFINDSLPRNW